jgi:hypothetical protein
VPKASALGNKTQYGGLREKGDFVAKIRKEKGVFFVRYRLKQENVDN